MTNERNKSPFDLAFRAMVAGSGVVLLLILCAVAVVPRLTEPSASSPEKLAGARSKSTPCQDQPLPSGERSAPSRPLAEERTRRSSEPSASEPERLSGSAGLVELQPILVEQDGRSTGHRVRTRLASLPEPAPQQWPFRQQDGSETVRTRAADSRAANPESSTSPRGAWDVSESGRSGSQAASGTDVVVLEPPQEVATEGLSTPDGSAAKPQTPPPVRPKASASPTRSPTPARSATSDAETGSQQAVSTGPDLQLAQAPTIPGEAPTDSTTVDGSTGSEATEGSSGPELASELGLSTPATDETQPQQSTTTTDAAAAPSSPLAPPSSTATQPLAAPSPTAGQAGASPAGSAGEPSQTKEPLPAGSSHGPTESPHGSSGSTQALAGPQSPEQGSSFQADAQQAGQSTQPEAQQPQPKQAASSPQAEHGHAGATGGLLSIQSAGDRPDRYSLRFQDADIREVLRMLGQLMGVNILISQGVQGTTPAASLEDVSLEEAFDALIRAMDYVCVREGKFWYVMTSAEAKARQKAEQELVVRVYRPHYISVADLQALVAPLITPNVGKLAVTNPNQSGLKLDSEDAGGDRLAQQDALLVQDYPSVIEKIDQVVAEMDVPPLQVAIEAEILSVRLDDDLSLGVNFALLDGTVQTLALSGNGQALHGAGAFPNGSHKDFSDTATLAEFLADTAGLKFGIIHGDVGAFIKALETITDTNLIAAPHLRVVNKQKAELMIGTEISYKTLAFNDNQTVENVQFLEAGTKLVIRPFISPDGYIRLEVHPERSSATINESTGLPDKVTTQVTTNILVRDQETIVIGGLIEEEVTTTYEQIPVLGDLPWVGAAFRNKTETVTRHELIILLTPRIVWDDVEPFPGEPPEGSESPGVVPEPDGTQSPDDEASSQQPARRKAARANGDRPRPARPAAAKARTQTSGRRSFRKPLRLSFRARPNGRTSTKAKDEPRTKKPADRGRLVRFVRPIRLRSEVSGEKRP